MGDLSKDFLPTAIAWNFSGFAIEPAYYFSHFCTIKLYFLPPVLAFLLRN
jgi:hypothetical protein